MTFAWTSTSVPSGRNYSAIAHGGGVYCAIVYGSSVVATSPDGVTWTEGAMPASSNWQDVAWNGSVFCAVSYTNGTVAATSPDGVTWTAQTMPATAQWVSIAWNGTVFCAIAAATGGTTVAATSPDGVTWTAQTLPTSANWSTIAWNGSVFCATVYGGTAAATSPDGITWTARTLPVSANWFRIVWNGVVFCVVATNSATALTSPDGVTWTSQTMPSSGWNALTAGAGSHLLVALRNAVGTESATSDDHGVTWTSQTLPASATWEAVHAGSADVVALSTGTHAAIASGVAASVLTVDATDSLATASSITSQVGFTLADTTAVAGDFTGETLANLIDRVNATGSVQGNFTLVGNANEALTVRDTLSAAWQLLVAESMATTGEALGTVTKLAALIDALVATGQASNSLTAFSACVEAVTLEGLIRLGFDPDLVDALTLTEAITTNTRLLGTALDSVTTGDTFDTFLRLSVIASDALTLTGDSDTLLRANADLSDQLLVYVALRIGGTDYVGYALNTDSKAASRHSNSQHDSYATFKGKHYAAGPNGIVEFTGSDDDGNAIPWSLTSFLLDFGNSKHKRMPDAFIGATSDGQLVLQVITHDPSTGVQSTDWYAVTRLPANGPGEGRVQIGRGLSSTWWQYTLTSVQGASLALDKIELRPIILDRRT